MAFAGQVIGLIDDVPTVAELFARIEAEYNAVVTRFSEISK